MPTNAIAQLIADRARERAVAGRTCVVAIDGRAGAGKTTVAAGVSTALGDCPVVHLDELYDGWAGAAAGSRLLVDRILRPLRTRDRVSYHRFDWAAGEYESRATTVPPADFVVVEGVLGAWGEARSLADVTVWLDAPTELRKKRALERDGSMFAPHWADWAAQEDRLLGVDDPARRADLVFSTDPSAAATAPALRRFRPTHPCGTGVLCLRGSSGHPDDERAQLLAEHGADAITMRWFGGPGQPRTPADIPLEQFEAAVDLLRRDNERVAVVGTSFGAEAALVTASLIDVDAVAAFAPTPVVWAGIREDGSQTSHWSYAGYPLPFVPFDDEWTPSTDPPAYADLYRRSLARHTDRIPGATIRVERIPRLLLVCGGDDAVWPSVEFAEAIRERRCAHGLATEVVTAVAAGHGAPLPGQAGAPVSSIAHGGSPGADRALGAAAWPHLVRLLGLTGSGHE